MQPNDKQDDQSSDSDLTHPSAEDWTEYLYGECSPSKRKALSAHGKRCDACRTRIAAWRRTTTALDEDRIDRRTFQTVSSVGLIKWAAALAILLSGIYGTVQATLNSRQIHDLRQSLNHATQALLDSNFKSIIVGQQAAIDRLRNEIERMRESSVAAAKESDLRMRDSIARVATQASSMDRELLINALEQIEENRSEELIALRKELETVAVLTEANFKKAQQQIVQLASFSGEREIPGK